MVRNILGGTDATLSNQPDTSSKRHVGKAAIWLTKDNQHHVAVELAKGILFADDQHVTIFSSTCSSHHFFSFSFPSLASLVPTSSLVNAQHASGCSSAQAGSMRHYGGRLHSDHCVLAAQPGEPGPATDADQTCNEQPSRRHQQHYARGICGQLTPCYSPTVHLTMHHLV